MVDHGDEGTTNIRGVSDTIEDDSSTPPRIVSEDGGAPSGRPHPRWLVPVIVIVIVAVVVAAGLVGWRVVGNRRHDSALESCNRAVKPLQEKTGSARMARYREAFGVKRDQVKDAKTVANMSRSVKAVGALKQPTVACKASMSTGDLNAEAGRARKLDGEYAAVSKSARAVLESKDAKTLEDARTALDGKKGEASRLLADSDGKVADNATRDGLQQAIDQAGQAKGDEAKAYQDAAKALQAAIDQVNASVQAKSQADQQAAAQAQAAQQQAQRQGTTQRRQASSNSGRKGSTQSRRPAYRPSGNRGGGGGGSSQAPAAPSAPQGGNGGIDWDQWIDQHKTPSSCHAGEFCPIG